MALDMDALHFTFQLPVVVVEFMAAAIMLMRWEWARTRRISEIDPTVTLMLGVFIGLIAFKQCFWMIQGALVAADLHDAALSLGSGHWLPIGANAAIMVSGSALISRVGSGFIGRSAYLAGCGACAALLVISALLTT